MRKHPEPGVRYLLAPALLLAALTGWILLWTLTNPPGTAPDEPSHYVKAVAAGRGEILGDPVPIAELQALKAFSEDSLRQVRNAYRSFSVPIELRTTTSPPCTALHQDVPATCLNKPPTVPTGRVDSIVGAYPPWLYLPEGALTWAAWSVPSGYVLARVGSALVSAGLLAAGLRLLLGGRRGHRPLLLAGVAVAVTPMAVFLSSQAGTSGAEVAGALASGAAVLRLSRTEPAQARTWWAAGAVLGVTALSRPLAPLWVMLAIAIGLGRLSVRGAWSRIRSGGRAAAGAVAIATVGTAVCVVWTQSLSLRTPVLWDRFGHGLVVAAGLVPASARQGVGVFGWQSVPLPAAVYWLWGLLAAGLLLVALAVGRWRDRLLLAGSVLAVAVVYELLAAAVFIQNGFGMQGRYILPALVMLPLLCVEVLADRLPARVSRYSAPVASAVIGLTAVGQFVAWAANGHRYAVGLHGPVWFASNPAWSPAGGWLVWMALACIPFVLTIAAAVVAYRQARPGPGHILVDRGLTDRTRVAGNAVDVSDTRMS